MKSKTKRCYRAINLTLFALLAGLGLLFTSGCESSNHDDEESAETPIEESDDSTKESAKQQSSNNPSEALFPDGLHPNSAGAGKIAKAFAAALGGASDETLPIVCLGDSITVGGYPAKLATITGREVINAGKGGEKSAGGAGRVATVLTEHNPAYLCILYGINDLISHKSTSEVIANLNSIVATAKATGVVPIVGTLTPVFGHYEHLQPEVNKLNSSIRGMGVKVANIAGSF